jgi:hypothetical protein
LLLSPEYSLILILILVLEPPIKHYPSKSFSLHCPFNLFFAIALFYTRFLLSPQHFLILILILVLKPPIKHYPSKRFSLHCPFKKNFFSIAFLYTRFLLDTPSFFFP